VYDKVFNSTEEKGRALPISPIFVGSFHMTELTSLNLHQTQKNFLT